MKSQAQKFHCSQQSIPKSISLVARLEISYTVSSVSIIQLHKIRLYLFRGHRWWRLYKPAKLWKRKWKLSEETDRQTARSWRGHHRIPPVKVIDDFDRPVFPPFSLFFHLFAHIWTHQCPRRIKVGGCPWCGNRLFGEVFGTDDGNTRFRETRFRECPFHRHRMGGAAFLE